MLGVARLRRLFLKPIDKPYRLSDGDGLYLEIRPSGAALWRYRYRLAGKENLFALGSFPAISVTEARALRDAARKLVAHGIHPAHQRKATRRKGANTGNDDTFAAAADKWLAGKREQWTARTYTQRQRLLQRDILPQLGRLPIELIGADQVRGVIEEIAVRAPGTATLARQCCTAILRMHLGGSQADLDFGQPPAKRRNTRSRRQRARLRAEQIPAFFEALERYRGQEETKIAIRLLWWTLLRPRIVLEAQWAEFDLSNAVWTVPARRISTAEPISIPLPRQSVEQLDALRSAADRSGYLLPNRHSANRPASHSIFIKAFATMGFTGRFSPDAIRKTGRVILATQIRPDELLVAGAATGTPQLRRAALQHWADYLDRLCHDADRELLPRRR